MEANSGLDPTSAHRHASAPNSPRLDRSHVDQGLLPIRASATSPTSRGAAKRTWIPPLPAGTLRLPPTFSQGNWGDEDCHTCDSGGSRGGGKRVAG